ncbi:unnamed protein product [Symbiodinium natans]|uniref:Uncharacterized protein n=1 Tax=Symbiodinium natans TaxID=878477 RepID=A0A812MWN2_9DINO|nr:unnamed protein product [Symbiodinium natans]
MGRQKRPLGPARKRRRLLQTVRSLPRQVELGSLGRLRFQRYEVRGRTETLLVVRGFASHVRHEDALCWAKETPWGYDGSADDMQFLTQWQFLDIEELAGLLQCRDAVRTVNRHVTEASMASQSSPLNSLFYKTISSVYVL